MGPAATEWWQLTDEQLAATLADQEEVIRCAQAQQAAALAELHSRGIAAALGYGSWKTFQVDLLRISPQEADRRLHRALALHPRTDGTITLPPRAPATAEAAASGVIGGEHVDEIIKTLDAFPDVVPDAEVSGYEQALVQLAKRADPHTVARLGRRVRALIEQDYGEPDHDDDPAAPSRELRVGWLRDGRLGIKGALDKETGLLLETLLSPHTKPRPAEDGQRDPRSAAERNADGFADLLEITQRAVDRPTEGGERPTVVVTMNLDNLIAQLTDAAQSGFATLNGEPITAEQARRIACDAKIVPAVLGSAGEVLDLGRTERLATREQRRALELRDKGCVKCGRKPKWCVAHHIFHWLDGGPTDVDNMCLLCTTCHRLVHHAGWQIRMVNRMPVVIPPDWIRRC